MYLEVTVGDHRPVTYRLTKSEIAVGALPTNEIVIKSPTISKRHLKLVLDNSHWFILDQGSTNGTFSGEEKLIPGRRSEFVPESEIQLGNEVYLRLLHKTSEKVVIDIAGEVVKREERIDQDKTVVLSLNDLKSAEVMAQERKKKLYQEKRRQDQIQKKADLKKMTRSALIGVLVLLVGAALNRMWNKIDKTTKTQAVIQQINKDMTNKIQRIDELESGTSSTK